MKISGKYLRAGVLPVLVGLALLALAPLGFAEDKPATTTPVSVNNPSSTKASDARKSAPISAEQSRKLMNLITGAKGHDTHIPSEIISTLGLRSDTKELVLRSYSALDDDNITLYEISVLPNAGGYLIARNDKKVNRVFQLDSKFGLISAIIVPSGGKPTAMPAADTTRLYNLDITAWRAIADELGGH